ncbi:hypothetical protein TRAPUB_13473 [Trametes pubescens]|uniref:Uncharacterized protein n=1 Tax=Trametes pubescens TaxID=154538 RepID=A0A1M2VQZ0_TRAPU|nr:hypothetical protein TRAPUB_7271 [Trametes pubescens]OJT10026.1 hypothetical protein TRAPUB_13490 [Trametes pubescens]OJT10029.1 hypothetical protein TRAPUB_13481 [Trametes pubescens]OJT10039.1 hypothetical protein TRAPUB_13473 [Trametes pubescens]
MALHAGWVKRLPVPPNVSTATRANIPSTVGSSRPRAKSVVAGAPKPPPKPARRPAQTPVTPPPTAAAKGKRREVPDPSPSPEPVEPASKRPRVEDTVDEDAEVPAQEPVEELPDALEKQQRIDKGYEDYYQAIRMIRRALGEHVSIESAFTLGAEIAASPERMARLQPGVKYTRECQLVDAWETLQAMQPALVECEGYFQEHPDEVAKLLTYMDAVAKRTRSEDLARLRDSVIEYSNPLKGVMAELSAKSARGFKHPHTARLLFPIAKIDMYDEDPETFRLRVVNGDKTLPIVAKDWPVFVYDEDLYEVGHMKAGLLRSLLLVMCYKHVYTGRSSAHRQVELYATYKGKPSLARKYKLNDVTPESIIYVAVLMRSALSSCTMWGDSDGGWSGPAFVRSLMRVFKMYPIWADNTLKWWRLQVYGDVDDEHEFDVDPNGECAGDLIDLEGDDSEYEDPRMRKPVADNFQEGSSKDGGVPHQPSDDD